MTGFRRSTARTRKRSDTQPVDFRSSCSSAGFVSAIALLLALSVSPPAQAQTCADFVAPTVTADRRGSEVSIYVEVPGPHSVTLTLSPVLTNMRADRQTPHTATYPAGRRTRAMVLRPVSENAPWNYRYRYRWKAGALPGGRPAVDSYALPFESGQSVRVLQGPHGTFSHAGLDAWDWDLAEGSLVRAARDGVVAAACDEHDRNGPDISYARYNNYVYIQHADGSIAAYLHLAHASVLATTGQHVRQGDVVAESGNTGFSTRPHLHFEVFHIDESLERRTVPVRFRTADGIVSPRLNESYRSP